MNDYQTTIASGSHWSTIIRRGMQLTLTDIEGGANVGVLFYNPYQLNEKYNAPDTLKCQHTFKLTKGHCLYSDMGRIFCSIIEDDFGWHETICGNSHASHIEKWGKRNYQTDQNQWLQNGYDSFLTELAKYDLAKKDLASNLNFFSQVVVNDKGQLSLGKKSVAGAQLTLRFEMDTLMVLHTCPHPLSQEEQYPKAPIGMSLKPAKKIESDDFCLNLCDENRRGFDNNKLYYMGAGK